MRVPSARKLLKTTIRLAQAGRLLGRTVSLAALDGTGFESRHASGYYLRRRAKTGNLQENTKVSRFPKAGIMCDTRSHLILAVVAEQGPRPDSPHFRPALDQARETIRIEALAADAGYDSEPAHVYARERCGIRSLIPAKIGRPSSQPPRGRYRRQMKAHLSHSRYPQRSQVETTISMLKRLLGSALRGRSYWSRVPETWLRCITLNIMIIAQPP